MKDKRKNIEDELSEIAPFLANLKKDEIPTESFEVPKDYFNILAANIFDKTTSQPEHVNSEIQEETIIQRNNSTPAQRSLGRYFQWLWNPGFAVAMTSVVILIVAGVYLMKQESSDFGGDLTAADIEQYVAENIENFEIDQLVNMVVSIEETQSKVFPVEMGEIESEDLEKYIEDNFIDDLEIEDLM
ncbi:MAG: hypothetical protein ACJAUH_002964 [Saprospiraceae bacterium]|jgi:hypothetical protein